MRQARKLIFESRQQASNRHLSARQIGYDDDSVASKAIKAKSAPAGVRIAMTCGNPRRRAAPRDGSGSGSGGGRVVEAIGEKCPCEPSATIVLDGQGTG